MFQEIALFLPKEGGALGPAVLAAGALFGSALWLVGARYSRSLVTLALVLAGGAIGLRLPARFGWNIDGWATAVLAAVGLGVLGFALHRFWVGIVLGLVLAAGAAVGAWMVWNRSAAVVPPAVEVGMGWRAYAEAVARNLPETLVRSVVIAAVTAGLAGMLAAWFWPRLGRVTLYSVLGVSLLATAGVATLQWARPQWIERLPATPLTRAAALAAMVAFGAMVQWLAALSRPGNKMPREKPIVVIG